ncbi:MULTISPECIES: hypothetical protein [unclassified Spiroplasma]|uniref:hypothetical protein n=1 Tax=unclassified Spiroplasma TaxID=2637901 RepID=UPI001D457454|nr:hypothetical protein [Spiroplasma endosymbiont of Lariophagus distinguendus]MBP1526902.1 hypothetical protein [Spiroplasma ixodetis]
MNTFVIVGIIIIAIAIISFMLLFKIIKWLAICIIVGGIILAALFFGFGIWPLDNIHFTNFININKN